MNTNSTKPIPTGGIRRAKNADTEKPLKMLHLQHTIPGDDG
jgi:hypothetical protein